MDACNFSLLSAIRAPVSVSLSVSIKVMILALLQDLRTVLYVVYNALEIMTTIITLNVHRNECKTIFEIPQQKVRADTDRSSHERDS